MQRMFAEEVAVGLLPLAGQRETAVADAVGEAPDHGAEIASVALIGLEPVETQHQRRLVTGKTQVLDDGTQIEDVGRKPTATDGEAADFLRRLRCSKELAVLHAAVAGRWRVARPAR